MRSSSYHGYQPKRKPHGGHRTNTVFLAVDEIKSVPHVPQSHSFVERLIGTIRRECLDHTLFWNAPDLGVVNK
jgi:hypothetical protein